jgi:adenine-specific DNA-methyltransferase
MATGIPKRKQSDNPRTNTTSANGNALGLTLSYEGKKNKGEILATSPASMSLLWSNKAGKENQTINRLYFGENLNILASLLKDKEVKGKVKLIYIDPPYATGGVFQSRKQQDAYEDLLIGSHYVEFLRERLILLHELLAEDGSIYLHLDKNMAFALKMIMDEIFGAKNFRSWITRKKCNPKNYTTKSYGNVSDFILFYSKTDDYIWHRPVDEWTDEKTKKEYPCVDEKGRRYKKVPIHAPGIRNGETGQKWKNMEPPPGKHWQYLPSKLDEMDLRGEIYWSPTGNPRRKVYFDNSEGIPVQDIWLDFRDAHNQNIKVTGFPTEKNPELLERIIKASSNPGDLVLDCFCGSGTTLGAASELGRQWIGIDDSELAIATTLRRFTNGLQPMGDFVSARSGKGTTKPQLSLFLNAVQKEPNFDLFSSRVFKSTTKTCMLDLTELANLIDLNESTAREKVAV